MKAAKRTGRTIDNQFGMLHEVNCPECTMIQWHKQGKAICILCSSNMSIAILSVVARNPRLVNSPVKPEQETTE